MDQKRLDEDAALKKYLSRYEERRDSYIFTDDGLQPAVWTPADEIEYNRLFHKYYIEHSDVREYWKKY